MNAVWELWNIISGVASVIGVGLAIHFYRKSRHTDAVARGFHQAIHAEAQALKEELRRAEQIDDGARFEALRAHTEAACGFMKSHLSTIEIYEKTLWPKGGSGVS